MGAISAGWAARPKTVCEPNCLTFSLGKVEGISGVQTVPGATALTRTPCLIARLASDRVKLTMAALVDAQAMRFALGSNDWIDPVFIIDPPSFICGRSAWQRRNLAKALPPY